jgi:hypothetical protein
MFCKLFLSFFLLAAFFVSAQAQERVALVIGNGAYAHANALPNPANDADDMATALRDLNFQVIVATNLDKPGFDQKLRDFAKAIRTARTALFYYAGHGLQVAGKNYAIPVDAKLDVASDLTFEAIDLDFVVSLMQTDGDRVNLVFLDACRDNPLARSFARALPATRSGTVASGLSSVEAGRGTLIAFATAPNKVALDGRGRNSPFTGALVKHIGTPNLDIAFVMRRVTADVEVASNGAQIPWVHASLTKDVVLKAGTGAATPAPYTPPVKAPQDAEAKSVVSSLSPSSEVKLVPPPLPPNSAEPKSNMDIAQLSACCRAYCRREGCNSPPANVACQPDFLRKHANTPASFNQMMLNFGCGERKAQVAHNKMYCVNAVSTFRKMIAEGSVHPQSPAANYVRKRCGSL